MHKVYEERIKSGNNELIGNGNLDAISLFFAIDYIVHAGGKEHRGHGFINRWARQIRSAIPDIQVVKIEILSMDGELISWQRTLRGTHKEEMMGIKATGQKVEWRDMLVSRFRADKIVEEWAVSELAGELLSKSP